MLNIVEKQNPKIIPAFTHLNFGLPNLEYS